MVTACASVFVGLLLCSHYWPRLAGRVLTPWAFGLLMLTAILNHIVFCQALYLRAHKAEPFLVIGICGAAIMAASTYLLGRFVGVNATALGFFVATALFTAPVTHIFLKKRREWHADSPAATI